MVKCKQKLINIANSYCPGNTRMCISKLWVLCWQPTTNQHAGLLCCKTNKALARTCLLGAATRELHSHLTSSRLATLAQTERTAAWPPQQCSSPHHTSPKMGGVAHNAGLRIIFLDQLHDVACDVFHDGTCYLFTSKMDAHWIQVRTTAQFVLRCVKHERSSNL
jgi:hypothetical protein